MTLRMLQFETLENGQHRDEDSRPPIKYMPSPAEHVPHKMKMESIMIFILIATGAINLALGRKTGHGGVSFFLLWLQQSCGWQRPGNTRSSYVLYGISTAKRKICHWECAASL